MRNRVVVFEVQMVNNILHTEQINFTFNPSVKRIKGFYVGASVPGSNAGQNPTNYITLKLNNNKEILTNGRVYTNDANLSTKGFGYEPADIDLIDNSIVTGYVVNLSPNLAAGGSYTFHIYFNVEEEEF